MRNSDMGLAVIVSIIKLTLGARRNWPDCSMNKNVSPCISLAEVDGEYLPVIIQDDDSFGVYGMDYCNGARCDNDVDSFSFAISNIALSQSM